jgi:hypothetical protein
MNFYQVKTHKKFKRKNWEFWLEFDYYGRLIWTHSKRPVIIYEEDFEAEDWIASQ